MSLLVHHTFTKKSIIQHFGLVMKLPLKTNDICQNNTENYFVTSYHHLHTCMNTTADSHQGKRDNKRHHIWLYIYISYIYNIAQSNLCNSKQVTFELLYVESVQLKQAIFELLHVLHYSNLFYRVLQGLQSPLSYCQRT